MKPPQSHPQNHPQNDGPAPEAFGYQVSSVTGYAPDKIADAFRHAAVSGAASITFTITAATAVQTAAALAQSDARLHAMVVAQVGRVFLMEKSEARLEWFLKCFLCAFVAVQIYDIGRGLVLAMLGGGV